RACCARRRDKASKRSGARCGWLIRFLSGACGLTKFGSTRSRSNEVSSARAFRRKPTGRRIPGRLDLTMATIKKVSARNPARIKSVIKMLDAALEEWGEFLILRGVVDPGSLDAILVPDYQRGVLSPATINGLARAIKDSKVPDIELAVRGGDFKEREGCFYIKDPVYVVDGLQRITGARRVMQDGGEPYLGATLYFNTTIPWERE